MPYGSQFTCLLQGSDTLTLHCGAMLLEAGHRIVAVITSEPRVADWAAEAGVDSWDPSEAEGHLQTLDYDWVVSAANTDLIAASVLERAKKGAVNFHDGPLPRYAGLNAPVWALLNGETTHGITWHVIAGGIDEGDIVTMRRFGVAPDETALTLNAKCFGAASEAFGDVITAMETDLQDVTAQDLSERSYFGRNARPRAGALLDFTQERTELLRLVRALDHGEYWNPLSVPKLVHAGRVILVHHAERAEESSGDLARPGTVLTVEADSLTVATGDGALRLTGLTDEMGGPFSGLPAPGTVLDRPVLDAADAVLKTVAAADRLWQRRFETYHPAHWCEERTETGRAGIPVAGAAAALRQAFAVVVATLSGRVPVDLAWADPEAELGTTLPWRPVRFDPTGNWAEASAGFEAALTQVEARRGIAVDLPARCPDLAYRRMPDAALSATGPLPGAALTLVIGADGTELVADLSRISSEEHALIAARVAHLAKAIPGLDDATPVSHLPMLPETERELVLNGWNATETAFEADTCIHQFFEAQVEASPDREALAFESRRLTYAELDAAANRLAHVLISMGVGPGKPVGLHVRRSPELVIGALGILKAGGAYLPLDPSYPADRIALYVEDSGTQVILAEAGLSLETEAEVLHIDADPRIGMAPDTRPDTAVTAGDLAYMIYTSGSTGRPKGVMLEHRNVANFFVGMDGRIDHGADSVLLAVTSLSFDISVLELFWTLARGFKVVISGEEKMVAGDGTPAPRGGAMDFSLYYWGNDDGVGRDKYGLLLDGARFADANGFTAVWTPERHFHAFGGLYPNPSVTGAAVAAVTENIGVRAGSCVTPLHHPARIAEEWAVIDNLTNGRAGLAIASGWQPDDFVLRPENAPPNNKTAMFDMVGTLRKLWAGEEVEFEKADGTRVARLTQPRPVSEKLPLWVTTAGNPETWQQAGEIGANVLTHLLGQSIKEVGEKIAIYRAALRKAGHDPKDFTVTLMLHSFLAEDRETAREIAREPMKDYLRSAADLIKQYAWAFPAFKRPDGVNSPRQLDLGELDGEELEAILDFAFERYFERSGLFGTVEDALARVDEVKALGVTEIACLIDFGIERQVVLDGLRPLADVVEAANRETAEDYSLAGLIAAHDVTHLQCTPYMARMLVTNEASRAALGRLRHLMVGGEMLSSQLVADLEDATEARIENMYGPTETTIWSTTGSVGGGQGPVSIGRPIANTQIYILDPEGTPCPVGVAGEIYIAGAGVARGYWERADLTAEKFLDDPFRPGNTMFRTGDLARWRADGTLVVLGRADAQVKVRGYRIEIGEIEAALEAEEGVTQAVVVMREDASGVGQLIGYITGNCDPGALKAALSAHLPDFMVPQRIMLLDHFPLTPNRKIDRKALPAPGATRLASQPAPAPRKPASPSLGIPEGARIASAEATARVAEIWRDLLKLDQVNPSDNFFEIGGHSLLAVEMHRAVQKTLGLRKLSIADIFRTPTLAGFSARVEALLEPGETLRPAALQPPNSLAESVQAAPDPASEVLDITARRRALREKRA